MKPILEHGYLTITEESIFKASKLSQIHKIFFINNSNFTINLTVNRVVDNVVGNMIRIGLPLLPFYSLDILDPGEFLYFEKDDFIRAKASAINCIYYTIDGEES